MPRPRLTYSNVVASLALFVALGGTSYAITKLPRNSVGSAQVRDGSLAVRDLAPAARSPGPVGPRGARGAEGPQGERGPSDVWFAPPTPNRVLPAAAGQRLEVRRINALPAGAWVLRFRANAYLQPPVPQVLHASCFMRVNGDEQGVGATVVGTGSGASIEAVVDIDTAITRTAAFNVTVECEQSLPASGQTPVQIVRPQILATRVGQVTAAP